MKKKTRSPYKNKVHGIIFLWVLGGIACKTGGQRGKDLKLVGSKNWKRREGKYNSGKRRKKQPRKTSLLFKS